jgi:hypothetical protein
MFGYIGRVYRDTKNWFNEITSFFGVFFILLVTAVFWMEGFEGYNYTALSYTFKTEFNLDPASVQIYRVIAKQGWNCKFVWGLISDNLPIYGYHVKPYLLMVSLISLTGYIMISFPFFSPISQLVGVASVLIQGSAAFANVLVASLIVKAGRFRKEGTASLQSHAWSCFSVGGVMAVLIGSMVITHFKPRDWFKVCICVPIAVAVLAISFKEDKSDFKRSFKNIFTQIGNLFKAFVAPPYIVVKTFTWIFLSNAMTFGIGTALEFFRVSPCRYLVSASVLNNYE